MNGRLFTGIDDLDLPKSVRRMTPEARKIWVDNYNSRFTVVEICTVCGKGLHANECTQHKINHYSSNVRVVLGMYERLTEEEKAEFNTYMS